MATDRPRVIVNDRCLRNVRTGVGHYVAELLAALHAIDPGLDVLPLYRTYFQRGAPAGSRTDPSAPPGSYNGPVAGGSRAPDWLRRIMQGAYELAFELLGTWRGYRLYHEPNHIPGPWQGPILTTVHDLSVLCHPQWHPVDRVRWYERDFADGIARSTHFISVSDFTRQEMIDRLHVAPERITTIHLGVREVFHPRPRNEVAEWYARNQLPENHLLFVGTLEPRKNVPGLLAAYARLTPEEREKHKLLLVGIGGWGEQQLTDLIERHRLAGCVRALGYVDDEELALLYCGARALVWPSLYEGFGLPALESMASGAPVITSRAASLPEVVGDAGVLVDPRDESALAEAIRRVLQDEAWAARLSASGLERSRQFSWRDCAARHAYLYQKHAE